MYKDQYNQIKGLQVLKVVIDTGTEIVCFYRSPNQTKEEIEETIEFFKKIPDRAILVGDLNIPEADWIASEILKSKGCRHRSEKEDLILTLTVESDRQQKVSFATNKFNDNILDVLIVPSTKTVKDLKEISSPDKGEDAGTDHRWFKFEIGNERSKNREEVDQIHNKIRVNYEKMNEILEKKKWEHQEVQEEIHNPETCGMCELTTEIRRAEHLATTTTQVKKKFSRIPKGLLEQQKLKYEIAKEKRGFSEVHERRYKEESKLYDKMCKDNYVREQREFEKRLKKDRNAIYQPLKNQSKGNVVALKDDNDTLHTTPKKVVEIHAESLMDTIAKNPKVILSFEEIEKKVEEEITSSEESPKGLNS